MRVELRNEIDHEREATGCDGIEKRESERECERMKSLTGEMAEGAR